jgi:hypothetical protein
MPVRAERFEDLVRFEVAAASSLEQVAELVEVGDRGIDHGLVERCPMLRHGA